MRFGLSFLERRATPQILPIPLTILPTQTYMGNDGNWSSFQVAVGTSNPRQLFNTLVSFSGDSSWFALAGSCPSNQRYVVDNCAQLRGTVNPTSSGWQFDQSSSYTELGIVSFGLGPALQVSSLGVSPVTVVSSDYSNGVRFGLDTITFNESGGFSVPNSPITGIIDYGLFSNTLGIGSGVINTATGQNVPSLLTNLAVTNQIPSKSFGYTAGAFYNNTFGSLTLGGYDAYRIRSPVQFTMGTGLDSSKIQVSVNSIGVEGPGRVFQAFNVDSNNRTTTYNALIDPTLPFLYLPEATCNQFEQQLGLLYNETQNIYYINATQRAANYESVSSIRIQISNLQTASMGSGINVATFRLPYAAFDLNMSFPVNLNGPLSYFPIRKAVTGNSAVNILGRTFLQEAFVIADYERQNFTIGQAIFDQAAQLNTIPIYNSSVRIDPESSQSSGGSNLHAGAIVGIVLGVIIAAVIGFTALWYGCYYRLRKRKEDEALRRQKEEEYNLGLPDDNYSRTIAVNRPEFHSRSNTANSVITCGTHMELDSQSKENYAGPSSEERPLVHRRNESYELGGDDPTRNPAEELYELEQPAHADEDTRANPASGSSPTQWRLEHSVYGRKEREAFSDDQADSLYGSDNNYFLHERDTYANARNAFRDNKSPSVTLSDDNISTAPAGGRSVTAPPLPHSNLRSVEAVETDTDEIIEDKKPQDSQSPERLREGAISPAQENPSPAQYRNSEANVSSILTSRLDHPSPVEEKRER